MFDGFLTWVKNWWSTGDSKDKVIAVLIAVIVIQFFL